MRFCFLAWFSPFLRVAFSSIAGLMLLCWPAFPQSIEIPKEWRLKDPLTLVDRTDFRALPYEGRRQVLMQALPRYAALDLPAQYDVLWEAERAQAKAEGRDPLKFLVWGKDHKRYWDSIYQHGEQLFCIFFGPLTLVTTVYYEGGHVVAWVYASLEKDASVQVNVIPERFILASVSPKPKLLSWESPDRMAQSTVNKSRIWAGLIGGLGGLAQTTRTTSESGTVEGAYRNRYDYSDSGTFSGTYQGTKVTREPDYQARAQAQQTAANLQARAQQKATYVSMTALRATTLSPGDKVSGLIYFKRDKKDRVAVLGILIGQMAFEFPFVWTRK